MRNWLRLGTAIAVALTWIFILVQPAFADCTLSVTAPNGATQTVPSGMTSSPIAATPGDKIAGSITCTQISSLAARRKEQSNVRVEGFVPGTNWYDYTKDGNTFWFTLGADHPDKVDVKLYDKGVQIGYWTLSITDSTKPKANTGDAIWEDVPEKGAPKAPVAGKKEKSHSYLFAALGPLVVGDTNVNQASPGGGLTAEAGGAPHENIVLGGRGAWWRQDIVIDPARMPTEKSAALDYMAFDFFARLRANLGPLSIWLGAGIGAMGQGRGQTFLNQLGPTVNVVSGFWQMEGVIAPEVGLSLCAGGFMAELSGSIYAPLGPRYAMIGNRAETRDPYVITSLSLGLCATKKEKAE